MVDKKTKFLVGLFVASGITILVLVVIWLGMTNFFKKGKNFAVYFDESVQGLNVEAPVKYRGVPIGRVARIRVAADSRLIEVVLEMNPGFQLNDQAYAQLKVAGITGSMFIELDHALEDGLKRSPKLNFPTEFPVIPSHPSEIKQLFQSIDEIVQRLKTIDIAGIAERFQQTLDHLDKEIVGADVAGLSSHIHSSLDGMDQVIIGANLPETVKRMNNLLAALEQSMKDVDLAGLSQETKDAVTSLHKESEILLRNAQPLVANASDTVHAAGDGVVILNRQMLVVSQELERVSEKLNTLLDRLNDQPSQLLFGEVPPRRIQQ